MSVGEFYYGGDTLPKWLEMEKHPRYMLSQPNYITRSNIPYSGRMDFEYNQRAYIEEIFLNFNMPKIVNTGANWKDGVGHAIISQLQVLLGTEKLLDVSEVALDILYHSQKTSEVHDSMIGYYAIESQKRGDPRYEFMIRLPMPMQGPIITGNGFNTLKISLELRDPSDMTEPFSQVEGQLLIDILLKGETLVGHEMVPIPQPLPLMNVAYSRDVKLPSFTCIREIIVAFSDTEFGFNYATSAKGAFLRHLTLRDTHDIIDVPAYILRQMHLKYSHGRYIYRIPFPHGYLENRHTSTKTFRFDFYEDPSFIHVVTIYQGILYQTLEDTIYIDK